MSPIEGPSAFEGSLAWNYLNGQGSPATRLPEHCGFARLPNKATPAQFQLAAMYCTGTGVVRNLTEAVKWYRRSAEQGDRYSQYTLAIMLLKGQGTPPDPDEAFRWCTAAADQGLPEAQRQLGDLYRTGLGTAADPASARAWYEKAVSQGNTEAAAMLHLLRESRAV